MKNRSLHKNLDTSFVNLPELVKYLRKRQFVGNIGVQLNGYRANILLKDDNTLGVYEHDEISGRIAEGEEALQRVLIRSREPGGTIDVFQHINEDAAKTGDSTGENGKPVNKDTLEVLPEATRRVRLLKPSHPVGVSTTKVRIIKNSSPQRTVVKPAVKRVEKNGRRAATNGAEILGNLNKPSLPDFPFKLSNKVEGKVNPQISVEDWRVVLRLTVELLAVIDRSLAEANLNFSAEFQKICCEISDDYPFLNVSTETFRYGNGKIQMKKQISEKTFVSGIAEALREILVKLSKSRKYSGVYKITAQRLQIIITKRSPIYKKFGISTHIRRIVSP